MLLAKKIKMNQNNNSNNNNSKTKIKIIIKWIIASNKNNSNKIKIINNNKTIHFIKINKVLLNQKIPYNPKVIVSHNSLILLTLLMIKEIVFANNKLSNNHINLLIKLANTNISHYNLIIYKIKISNSQHKVHSQNKKIKIILSS